MDAPARSSRGTVVPWYVYKLVSRDRRPCRRPIVEEMVSRLPAHLVRVDVRVRDADDALEVVAVKPRMPAVCPYMPVYARGCPWMPGAASAVELTKVSLNIGAVCFHHMLATYLLLLYGIGLRGSNSRDSSSTPDARIPRSLRAASSVNVSPSRRLSSSSGPANC